MPLQFRSPGLTLGILTFSLAGILVGTAHAVSTPNPAGRWIADQFFLAGDFSFVSEKDLDGGGEVEDMLGLWARPSYSIARNVVVYGRVGLQDADGLDAGPVIGGGVQGAYVLPRAPRWAVGGAFDLLHWRTESDGSGRDVDWTEFQFTPAVSYAVSGTPFVPYAGVMFDFLAGDVDEDDVMGLLVGTNFDIQPRVRLDAQLRLVSETGFFFSAGYLF